MVDRHDSGDGDRPLDIGFQIEAEVAPPGRPEIRKVELEARAQVLLAGEILLPIHDGGNAGQLQGSLHGQAVGVDRQVQVHVAGIPVQKEPGDGPLPHLGGCADGDEIEGQIAQQRKIDRQRDFRLAGRAGRIEAEPRQQIEPLMIEHLENRAHRAADRAVDLHPGVASHVQDVDPGLAKGQFALPSLVHLKLEVRAL